MNVLTSFTSDDFGFDLRPATRNLKNFVVMIEDNSKEGDGGGGGESCSRRQLNAEAGSSNRMLCLFEENETRCLRKYFSV